VLREGLEAALGAARRRALHRRVAEGLERAGGLAAPDTLAYHYARGGAQEKAAQFLEAAGDRARAQYAHGAAERQYRSALERYEGLERPQAVAGVREKLGAVLCTLARYEEALAVLEQAVEAYGATGDTEGAGRALAQIGRAHTLRGTPSAGLDRLQPLLPALQERAPSPALAALYTALAHLYYYSGRYGEELAAAEQAAAVARALHDERLLAAAAHLQGWALALVGRTAEGLRVLEEALALAEAVGDLTTLCDLLDTVGFLYTARGEFERGQALYERAVTVAERLDDPQSIAIAVGHRGVIACYVGQWEQARADFERGVSLSRQAGAELALTYTLIYRGWLRLWADEGAAATEDLAEELALVERSGDLQLRRNVQRLWAEHDLGEGRPAAARARLVPLLDRVGLEELDVTRFLPLLAWAQLELGEVPAAMEVAEQAVRRARAQGWRLLLPDALRVQALVALRRGRWAEAAQALGEGLEVARGLPFPHAEARLLQVGAELHTQRGEPGPARERLTEALALFRRLGARRQAAQVDQALAALSQKRWPRAPRLSDAQWGQIAALLPQRPPGRGRPRADDRRVVDAILYVQRHRCAWAALPAELGDGATAHRRWQEWQAAGLWERIVALAGTSGPVGGADGSAAREQPGAGAVERDDY
jgi:transposase/Tfp pilus assembly protein PilF